MIGLRLSELLGVDSMRVAEWINITFFCVLTGLSWFMPLPGVRRWRIMGLATIGLGLTLAGSVSETIGGSGWGSLLRDWLPAPILLIAYWQAGQFYLRPRRIFQDWLQGVDDRLARSLADLYPLVSRRWGALYLEIVYLLAYPLVPLGLAVLYIFGRADSADRFWSVVLPSAYLCYAMLPFLPTMPPRLAGGVDSLRNRGERHRILNLRVLDRLGIGANTFPSGHVAATTASSLVVLDFFPEAGFVLLWMAVSIAVSVVVRRYHYFADAALGIVLALGIWLFVRGVSG